MSPRGTDLQAALARVGFTDPVAAQRHLDAIALGREGTLRVGRACAQAPDPDLALGAICRYIAMASRVPGPEALARLAAVVGLSSTLGQFIARHPEFATVVTDARHASRQRPRKILIEQAAKVMGRSERPEVDLRRWKRREMLRIAGRDLGAGAEVEDVAHELSSLAEACVRAALTHAMRKHPLAASERARLCVIALGKLGGDELNYVSDIDLIFVIDGGGDGALDHATQVFSTLIETLGAQTEDGQAYRVDTTLRPEGRSGGLVRSLAAYRTYYERHARPWEFQALLKARPIAGDAALGQEFMDLVTPMIYPPNFSPDAVREIRDLKARAERAIAASGKATEEIKRGPGGIRDIEFAVQLLQLVHARRDEALRTGNTLEGLAALAHRAYVGDTDARELEEAYRFLRRVEHRLQLAQERQTHIVPADERARRRLARAMGFRDTPEVTALEAFETTWRETQRVVRRIHEKLFYRPLLERFAQAPALAPDAAQERLNALGFRQPGRALKFLGDLTSGLSRRAQLMRTLLPVMLDWMSEAPDPDLAVAAFRDVALAVGGNPSALAVMRDSPPVVELLCRVLGTSRMLGEYLVHVPDLVGDLADERTLRARSREEYVREAFEHVEWRGDAEARDTALRRLGRRGMLRIACRDLAGATQVEEIGRELSYLAEGAVRAGLDSVLHEHPGPQGARFLVVGMGKFGGEELAYGSDLDVMFVYDAPDERAAFGWATEVGEALIARLAASTEEGVVFRVDAALRPEGRNGALARSLASYRAYYDKWAEPWEFQALIKARPVAGDDGLAAGFTDLIAPYVYRERMPDEWLRSLRTVKARIERERLGPDKGQFDVKLGPGGLLDIEFTAQVLQLQFGAANAGLRAQSTLRAIRVATESSLLDLERGRWLTSAYRLLARTRNAMVLQRGRPTDVLPTDHEELESLARALGYPAPAARVEFVQAYRRATRRARSVCEDVFYGGRLSHGAKTATTSSAPSAARVDVPRFAR